MSLHTKSDGTPLRVRRIRPEEIEATARMWQRSQRAAYTWFRDDQFHPLDDALAFFRSSICERCEVWVASAGDAVVGVLALEGDWVDHLFVDPEAQGQGVGSRLLEQAKALRGDRLVLVTLQRNERARGFYERRGFVATGFGTSPPPEDEPDVYYEWRPRRDEREKAMVSWSQLESQAPEIAEVGRRRLTGTDGVSIGFLATVSLGGLPRIAPVCPIFCREDLYLSAGAHTPKVAELRRSGAYALHAFLGENDEEFQIAGRATEVLEPDERAAVHDAIPFPAFDKSDPIFRLGIERALWVHWERAGQPDMRPVRIRWPAR